MTTKLKILSMAKPVLSVLAIALILLQNACGSDSGGGNGSGDDDGFVLPFELSGEIEVLNQPFQQTWFPNETASLRVTANTTAPGGFEDIFLTYVHFYTDFTERQEVVLIAIAEGISSLDTAIMLPRSDASGDYLYTDIELTVIAIDGNATIGRGDNLRLENTNLIESTFRLYNNYQAKPADDTTWWYSATAGKTFSQTEAEAGTEVSPNNLHMGNLYTPDAADLGFIPGWTKYPVNTTTEFVSVVGRLNFDAHRNNDSLAMLFTALPENIVDTVDNAAIGDLYLIRAAGEYWPLEVIDIQDDQSDADLNDYIEFRIKRKRPLF